MAKQTSGGNTAKMRRDLYKSSKRMESNRKKKLEKQLKLQPNNKNLEIALKNIEYRRKTPKSRVWSSTMIQAAKLFKLFGGRFDPKMLHADPKISQAALSEQSVVASIYKPNTIKSQEEHRFFSIGARVIGKGWN